ncbi:hypothetical protein MINT15_36140 [Saccharomonospora viridis]|jgi:hypothetical protein|uniref:Uncharacterized protein n=1 Tax=Saccharomonospora viridis TaxID=1852 RepID=A0A837D7J0_9PSEU|nr:hypothetical protein MINT15_36140 [Saccharomonospora viridis]
MMTLFKQDCPRTTGREGDGNLNTMVGQHPLYHVRDPLPVFVVRVGEDATHAQRLDVLREELFDGLRDLVS